MMILLGVSSLWQLLRPTSSIDFWTMMLFFGTCGLFVVASRGLHALKLTKTDIELRNQREASACAISRCEEMAGDVMSANVKLLAASTAEKVELFVKSAEDVQFEPDNANLLKAAIEWRKKVSPQLDWQSCGYLNRLEAWSMYFTNGVADHRVAFGPCAPVFCQSVVRSYAILLTLRSSPSSGRYPNIVKLFKAWNGLLEAEQRGLKASDLMKQLDALTAKSREPLDLLPVPLGARIDP